MLVYYCAKCLRQNTGNRCDVCGRGLGSASVRFVWSDSRPAISDLSRVGLLTRVTLIASVIMVLAMLVIEYIYRGAEAFTYFFTSSYILEATLQVSLLVLIIGLVVLLLQGRETVQYVLDPKGVLKRTWIVPSRIRCWSRAIRYDKGAFEKNSEGVPFLMAHEEYLVWQDAARYKLSPRSGRISLYRPYAFLFMLLHLPREEFDQAAALVAAKLKNKK